MLSEWWWLLAKISVVWMWLFILFVLHHRERANMCKEAMVVISMLFTSISWEREKHIQVHLVNKKRKNGHKEPKKIDFFHSKKQILLNLPPVFLQGHTKSQHEQSNYVGRWEEL